LVQHCPVRKGGIELASACSAVSRGSIGVERAVRSAPDGYTIGVGNWSAHVLNGAIYTLNYDLVSDLEPVALLPSAPQVIVSRKASRRRRRGRRLTSSGP
jgi:tripartite-type tricarboxylate transporter receptor subunit TctC